MTSRLQKEEDSYRHRSRREALQLPTCPCLGLNEHQEGIACEPSGVRCTEYWLATARHDSVEYRRKTSKRPWVSIKGNEGNLDCELGKHNLANGKHSRPAHS